MRKQEHWTAKDLRSGARRLSMRIATGRVLDGAMTMDSGAHAGGDR